MELKEIKKFIYIKKILLEEDCFLKMSIEQAYSILIDLGIPKYKLKEIYDKVLD